MTYGGASWLAGRPLDGGPAPAVGAGGRRGASLFHGARVLVVEDEMLVAIALEDHLTGLGCEVLGPVATVADALDLLGEASVDVAVLDVNLGGEAVFPVAEHLAGRAVPFVFATAYGVAGLPEGYLGRPLLEKPYAEAALEDALRRLLAAGKAH